MAPNQSKPQERSTTKNGIKLIKPPIGLERPKQESGKYSEKIKCRTNPEDASSTTYKIPMEYFKEGTPEEWLIFQDKLGRCITGQNATSGVANSKSRAVKPPAECVEIETVIFRHWINNSG